jgi:hypothetical protein
VTPFERLVRRRPDPDALWKYKRQLKRPIEITFDARMGLTEGEVTWDLGPEVSRKRTYVKYVATYHSIHEGSYSVVLHVREGELEPLDDPEGTCELGAILSSMEWYEFGTDLVTLRDSGFRLSWEAAQWLYEAARDELVDLHHDGGKAHGAITPRGIRLALFDTPYGNHNQAYLPRHENGDVPAPVLFLYRSTNTAGDTRRAVELSVLAFAIVELTRHPDPQIDQFLRDTSHGSHEVLRDLLLERGAAVERLVRDRCNTPSLALLPLAGEDDEAIDDELEALWHRVLELDPMIDTTNTEIFDLAGPNRMTE